MRRLSARPRGAHRRAAEAAALRFLVLEEIVGNARPTIVLGDLNDAARAAVAPDCLLSRGWERKLDLSAELRFCRAIRQARVDCAQFTRERRRTQKPFAGIETSSTPSGAVRGAPRLPTSPPPYCFASLLRISVQLGPSSAG